MTSVVGCSPWLLAGCLLVTMPAQADDAICAMEPAARSVGSGVAATPEPRWTTRLLDALTASQPTLSSLRAALDDVPDVQQHDPLVAQGRVVLAALLLQAGRREEARAQLRRVDTDAPAALDAGLLFAESHAADAPEDALRWNLRVVRRWPDEPRALSALLQRAVDMPDENRAAMLAALQDVQQGAQQAATQLVVLRARLQQENWYAQWLDDGNHAPPLTGELLPVFYRTVASASFRAARNAREASLRPALCARARQAQLASLRDDVARMESEARQALALMQPRQVQQQQTFTRLQADYAETARNHPGEIDLARGQELNRLRNTIARDAADIVALQSMVDGLPAARARLDERAQRLAAVSSTINRQAGADMLAALQATLDERIATLRDIAGSAAQRLGEMQDPRYRKAR